jgi:hypothetical protein
MLGLSLNAAERLLKRDVSFPIWYFTALAEVSDKREASIESRSQIVQGSNNWAIHAEGRAREVHGEIRRKWALLGLGAVGPGLSANGHTRTGAGLWGQFSLFEGGSICWTPGTGSHEVRGLFTVAGRRWVPTGAPSDVLFLTSTTGRTP